MTVPLTDPELDLLRELLTEDPGADAFVDVARELVRRERWGEAVRVLSAGLELNRDRREGWELLARAAVEDGQFLRALGAIDVLDPTPDRHPALVALQVAALAGAGEAARAEALAESLQMLHPNDPVVAEASRRVRRTPSGAADQGPPRGSDPLVSLERADAYVRVGRTDRAVRVLRRLLHSHPHHPALHRRLRELLELPHEPIMDDLSEELPDPQLAPDLSMPAPSLPRAVDVEEDDDEITQPQIDLDELRRRAGQTPRPLPGVDEVVAELAREGDDEQTDPQIIETDDATDPSGVHPVAPDGTPGEFRRSGGLPTRKRRSLIRK